MPPPINAQVWSYWTGPQPAWIGLCLESLRRACPTAVVLDDSYWTSPAYTGSLPAELILALAPNQRSDVLRAYLLATYGGVWVDADAIVWRDLRRLANYLSWRELVAYRTGAQVCSALLASRPGAPIAAAYWRAVATAAERCRPEQRLALGPALLLKIIQRLGWHRVHFLPLNLVHPVLWKNAKALHADSQPSVPADAWTWMLTASSIGPLADATRKTILDSPTLLGRVFRRALADKD
jgi:hypothetical protein